MPLSRGSSLIPGRHIFTLHRVTSALHETVASRVDEEEIATSALKPLAFHASHHTSKTSEVSPATEDSPSSKLETHQWPCSSPGASTFSQSLSQAFGQILGVTFCRGRAVQRDPIPGHPERKPSKVRSQPIFRSCLAGSTQHAQVLHGESHLGLTGST